VIKGGATVERNEAGAVQHGSHGRAGSQNESGCLYDYGCIFYVFVFMDSACSTRHLNPAEKKLRPHPVAVGTSHSRVHQETFPSLNPTSSKAGSGC